MNGDEELSYGEMKSLNYSSSFKDKFHTLGLLNVRVCVCLTLSLYKNIRYFLSSLIIVIVEQINCNSSFICYSYANFLLHNSLTLHELTSALPLEQQKQVVSNTVEHALKRHLSLLPELLLTDVCPCRFQLCQMSLVSNSYSMAVEHVCIILCMLVCYLLF